MKSARWIVGWALVSASVAACDTGEVSAQRDSSVQRDATVSGQDGSMITPTADGSASGPDASAMGGDAGGDGGPISVGPARPEECGNAVDDDNDGEVDEGCNCAVGTERACYLGPVGTLNRGACRAGNQRCESTGARAIWGACVGQVIPTPEIASNGVDDDCNGMTDEPGALCLAISNNESATECGNGRDDDCDGRVDCLDPGCATAGRCMTMRCTSATEDTCFGGVDEDCDGSIDCMDPDCARDPSCMPSVCPQGQTPVYTERTLAPASGASGILPGDNRANFAQTCVAGRCPQGQVSVVRAGQPAICVPPPPSCPTGRFAAYRGSSWVCEGPCEIIVRYGYMFGFRQVCTERPRLMCPAGQSPTFDFSTERWLCRATCDNTTYDRVLLDGLVLCVPC